MVANKGNFDYSRIITNSRISIIRKQSIFEISRIIPTFNFRAFEIRLNANNRNSSIRNYSQINEICKGYCLPPRGIYVKDLTKKLFFSFAPSHPLESCPTPHDFLCMPLLKRERVSVDINSGHFSIDAVISTLSLSQVFQIVQL